MARPPHQQHHWECETCGVDLGTIRQHHQGGTILHAAPGLYAATKIEPGVFILRCHDGHETRWRGNGIKWFVDRERRVA